MTHTQRRAEMQRAEADGTICPCTAQTVHLFDDGWRIVRLETVGDFRREGWLMRSCCASYVGDKLIPDSTFRYRNGDADSADAAPQITHDSCYEMGLDVHHSGMALYSLRDQANLPHLTVWAEPGWGVIDEGGYRNPDTIRQTYRRRLDAWIRATDSLAVDKTDRKLRRVLRMRAVPAAQDERARYEQISELLADDPALEWARARAKSLIITIYATIGYRQDALVHSLDTYGPDIEDPDGPGLDKVREGWRILQGYHEAERIHLMQQLEDLAEHALAGKDESGFEFSWFIPDAPEQVAA
jgi:hypothetical protein